MPRIPNGLLERCLETIPVTTVSRQRVARPNLDDRSRKRLVWLSAVAAIPVLTVLALLPLRNWNHDYRSRAETNPFVFPGSVEKLSYVRKESIGTMSFRWAGKNSIVPNQRLLEIVDRKRGACFLIQGNSIRDKTRGSEKYSELLLPNGKHYIINPDTKGTVKWEESFRWSDIYGMRLSRSGVWVGPLTGWASLSVPKPVRFTGTWKGQPALVEACFCDENYKNPSLDAKVDGYRIRIERYSSVETGLAIALRILIDVQPGKVTGVESALREMADKRDVCYYQAEYYYQPLPGEDKYFNPTEFLKAAKQITP